MFPSELFPNRTKPVSVLRDWAQYEINMLASLVQSSLHEELLSFFTSNAAHFKQL